MITISYYYSNIDYHCYLLFQAISAPALLSPSPMLPASPSSLHCPVATMAIVSNPRAPQHCPVGRSNIGAQAAPSLRLSSALYITHSVKSITSLPDLSNRLKGKRMEMMIKGAAEGEGKPANEMGGREDIWVLDLREP